MNDIVERLAALVLADGEEDFMATAHAIEIIETLRQRVAEQNEYIRTVQPMLDEYNVLKSQQGEPVALAQKFHEAYERLAPSFGYATRQDTKTFDPESPNGKLMIAVCAEISSAPTTEANVWKESVLDQCLVAHSAFYEDDPKKTLDTLIDWHIKIALDPQVSSDAQALIDSGRQQDKPFKQVPAVSAQEKFEMLRDVLAPVMGEDASHIP